MDRVSEAGGRPSWIGGRTERPQAISRSIDVARRVVVQVQTKNFVELNNHPALRAPLLSRPIQEGLLALKAFAGLLARLILTAAPPKGGGALPTTLFAQCPIAAAKQHNCTMIAR